MYPYPQEESCRPPENSIKNVTSRRSLVGRLLASRRARRLERRRQIRDQRLAWRVQDIIVGCGLFQADYSIGGGRSVHIPQVTSVVAGPPVGLNIHMLPGQVPEDFVRHAHAIAYNLGVAEVRVIPRGPSLIRLELLPK